MRSGASPGPRGPLPDLGGSAELLAVYTAYSRQPIHGTAATRRRPASCVVPHGFGGGGAAQRGLLERWAPSAHTAALAAAAAAAHAPTPRDLPSSAPGSGSSHSVTHQSVHRGVYSSPMAQRATGSCLHTSATPSN